MTPRFSARQNKTRLIAVFLFTVLVVLTVQVFKGQFMPGGSSVSNAETLDDSLFIGLRRANPGEVKAALPEASGKPMLLVFSSRLCHDCQRMAPVLSSLVPKHPGVYYKKVDVLDDKARYPAVFRTFKPVSVPVLVFINSRGEIRNVLYNYQKPATVASALGTLERQELSVKAAR